MKIEKISEKQIKCTLNRSDLMNHQIKISELAYGTDNAKELFHDMMEEAFNKFGFEADDIPLMIEAIPVSSDCIVLLITKVENPDEIDNKLARISPNLNPASSQANDLFDDINGLFPMMDEFPDNANRLEGSSNEETFDPSIGIYDFDSLDNIIRVSHILADLNISGSAVFKSISDNVYYVVLRFSEENRRMASAIHSTILEFGKECANSLSIAAFIHEHCEALIEDQAIQKLAQVSL